MKGAVRRNLKPSGNEFIDGIPEDWQSLPMKSLGWYASSGIDKKEQEDEPSVLMVNYMDIYGNSSREIDRSRPLMSTTCPAWKVKECNLQQGDLVFTPSSETPEDIGLSALIREDLPNTVFSYHVLRFRFTKPVELGFKKYLCNNSAVLHQFSSVCQGTTRQILNRGEFRNALVALPSPAEQRAIATFLDRETGRLDRLVAKKRELIERLKEKRTALISRAVTRGLPPAAGLPENPPLKPSGLDWLGDIPRHWGIGPLKSFAKDGRKTFTDGDWVELPFITDEGVRLIQTGNVGIGAYKEQGFRYVSEASFGELGCTEVMPNDVLICRLDGPVGRACLAPNLGVRMITSVDNTILKVSSEVSPLFVVYLLSSAPWLSWIDALCRVGGGFRMRISRTMLGNIRVPFPPFPEQAAIAAYLDAETAKLDALVGKVEEAVERLQEYRTALITAAVIGKIDVREKAAA